MQILRDIYMLCGNAYGNIANLFLLRGENGLVLIDTADRPEDIELVDRNLEYWGLSHLPITHVLITHNHFNHIGNAHILRSRGAKIIAGALDADAIESGDVNTIIDFAPFPVREYTPCAVDLRVNDGDEIEAAGLTFTCIHVPGHTEGSMVYQVKMNGKTILFTGDVLNIGANCRSTKMGWEGGLDHDRQRYFESIRKLSKVDCDIILPAHFQLALVRGKQLLEDAVRSAIEDFRSPMVFDHSAPIVK